MRTSMAGLAGRIRRVGARALLPRPSTARPSRRGWSRAVVVCGLLGLPLMTGLFRLALDSHPPMVDPEYGRRLASLREHLRHKPPGQPVVVLIGSSRVAMGVRPDRMWADLPPDQRPALCTNFGMCGANPVVERVCLARLLRDGVRPSLVVVEVWPPLLSRAYYREVGCRFLEAYADRLRGPDMMAVAAALPDPKASRGRSVAREMFPWSAHRRTVLLEWAPWAAPPATRLDPTYRHLDEWGWLRLETYQAHPPETEYRARVEEAAGFTRRHLDPFDPCPEMTRPLRELLEVARGHGIRTAFVLMPDPPAVRAVYRSVPAGERIRADLHQLGGEFGTAVLDGRDWLGDEWFADGSHLTPAGAAACARLLAPRVADVLNSSPDR